MPNRNPIKRLIESGVVLKCPHKSVNASIMNMLEQNTFLYQIVALERRIKRVERIRTENEFARRGELSSGQIESFQGFPPKTRPPIIPRQTKLSFFFADLHLSLTQLPSQGCLSIYRFLKSPKLH